MRPHRREKLSSLYRKLISDFLHPRLRVPQGIFALTRVEVSERGGRVKIYFSVWPDPEAKNVLQSLKSFKKELRAELAREVQSKTVPELEFSLDKSAR